MRYLLALCAAAALAVPSVAVGGGWATVGVEPLPDGTAAGETWSPTIFIKQHGRTPLGGLVPTVTITDDVSGETRVVHAEETSKEGVYRANVVFPSAGKWRVEVDSTFGESRLTYGPVSIASSKARADRRSFPVAAAIGPAALLALGAAALVRVRRRRR